jgi:hypothetical protein
MTRVEDYSPEEYYNKDVACPCAENAEKEQQACPYHNSETAGRQFINNIK